MSKKIVPLGTQKNTKMVKTTIEHIVYPLNDRISLVSQARMRSVSKFFRDTIILKKYSWYHHFKKIKENICKENLISIIFEMDQQYIQDEELYAVYLPIENHLYGSNLKHFIKLSDWYCCVIDFGEIMKVHGKEEDFDIVEEVCNHCEVYTEYRPLQSALIQLCFEEYNPDHEL